jgi:tetratricopeptide (TPR) repeat protein
MSSLSLTSGAALAVLGLVPMVIALVLLAGREPAPAAEMLGSSGATEIFRAANALYSEGEFAEARAAYEELVENGFGGADVLYNLGNTCYKSGDVGHAVISYERGLRIAPGHSDARANLEFIRAALADRQGRVATGGLGGVLEGIWSEVDPAMLVMLASLLYGLVIITIIIGIVRGGMAGWPLGVSLGLLTVLVLVGIAAGTKVYRLHAVREAVIIVEETGARTGPGEEFILEFRLHEGAKVRLSEQRGDWTRVSVSGTDLEGWLPAGALEAI